MRWVVLALLLALPLLARPGSDLPGDPPPLDPPPAPADVFALPSELRARLEAEVVRPARDTEMRLQRLLEFMFADDGLGLRYDLHGTQSAAETYRLRRGNCLAFTVLFVSLARAAGLRAFAQEAGGAMAWLQGDDTVFHAGHVNIGVRIGGRRFVVDFDPRLSESQRRPRLVRDQRLLAHYYNNHGAERLARGDASAQAWFEAALAQDPGFVQAWNNLGVLHLRGGDRVGAEAAYTQALRRDPDHMPTLTNLARMYREDGRTQALGALEQQLQRLRRRDPFHNFMLGLEHEDRGEHAVALAYFERAVKLHDGEHRFHFALARAHYQLGDRQLAERALERAYALGAEGERHAYQRKLLSLRP